MKEKWILVLSGLLIIARLGSWGLSAEPTVTPVFMFIYGYGPLAVGDVVEVYTSDGILCGRATVTVEGQYGLMPVYGNEPQSGSKEGADSGERLLFRINGEEVFLHSGREPRFGEDGDTLRFDLG